MICLLGGTFDPVHYGHLRPAAEAQSALGLREVRFVPAARPPHRAPPVADATHRCAMLALALEPYPGFRLDDRELHMTGPSYTVHTLESIRGEQPGARLCLMLGQDAFAGLPTWHRWTDILALASCVVLQRPGAAPMPGWARARRCEDAGAFARAAPGAVWYQPVSAVDVSATEVRARLARGEDVSASVPPAVLAYIERHRLYRTPARETAAC